MYAIIIIIKGKEVINLRGGDVGGGRRIPGGVFWEEREGKSDVILVQFKTY